MLNLNYYLNSYDFYSYLNRDEGRGVRLEILLSPHIALSSSFSNLFAERVALPILSRSYSTLWSFSIRATSLISNTLTGRVNNFFANPITLKKALSCLRGVERALLPLITRAPTNLPLLHYFDACTISLGRHIYVYAKDLGEFLSIPERIRGLSIGGLSGLLNQILDLLKRVGTSIGLPICQGASTAQQKAPADWLTKQAFLTVSDYTELKQQALVQEVSAYVAKRCIVSSTAFLINSLLITYSSYWLCRYTFSPWDSELQVVKRIGTYGLTIASGAILYASAYPGLRRLYEAHKQPFDHQQSTMQQFSHFFDRFRRVSL